MRKIITSLAAVLITVSVFAQTPEKISYQAVVRDNTDGLVMNTEVGMQVSILQGSESGTAIYSEQHVAMTNANGLVSVEIGLGTTTDNFEAINWANGPYFIKTETDLTGGTSYTITGVSQLLSVPYALHSKTAESITGEITETDPVFNAWDKDYADLTNTPTIPTVPANISDFTNDAGYLTEYIETDPQFSAWDKDYADLTNTPTIPTVPTNVGAFTNDAGYLTEYIETDPQFNAWDKSTGIVISESQISDLNHFTNADETDPSVPIGILTGDMQYWNGSEWVTLTGGSEGQVLTFTSGLPTWVGGATSSYTLNLEVSPASSGTVTGGGDYVEGTDIPLTANANSGFVFVNWTNSESSEVSTAASFTYTMPAQNTTLTANFNIEGGGTTVVEVTNSITGEVWMDRNLGASQVATSSTDADAYGDLYQWGRAADGHESRTSETTTTLSSSDTPEHGNFITNSTFPKDWRSPQNNNLWQGVSGINNPCPSGYRLPTEAEWEAECTSWSSNDAAGALASPLKLPMAGYRNGSTGTLNNMGSNGFYWSSTVDGTSVRYLYFGSSNALMYSDYRAYGFSVRCLKD